MNRQEKRIIAQKIALSVVIGTLMSSGIALAADKTGSVTIDNGTSGNAYGCVAIDYDNVKNSTLTVNGGVIEAEGLYGGQAEHGNAVNNKVIINGGTFDPAENRLSADIYGGYIEEGTKQDSTVSTASGNTVTITDGEFGTKDSSNMTNVYGGYIYSGVGDVIGNTVTIGSETDNKITDEDHFGNVIGGMNFEGEGDAQDNTVTIYGGNIYLVCGGDVYLGSATGNTVSINGGTFGDAGNYAEIYGGYVWEGDRNDDGSVSTASGNTVTITDGDFGLTSNGYAAEIYGGYISDGYGDISGNIVTIGSETDNKITNEDYFDYVMGGYNYDIGDVTDNTVTIYGGNIYGVRGGVTNEGNATGNTVNINGGIIYGVRGGASGLGNVTGNTVNINGGTFADSESYASIYGGLLWFGEENDDGTVSTVSGNTVTITDGVFGVTDDGSAADVYGGYIDDGVGDVIGNTVTIGSSVDNKITGEDYFYSVIGGVSFAQGEVKDNTVTIYGGDIYRTYGGYSYNGIAAGNTVNIYGGTVSGIYGGCTIEGGSVISNTVNINGGIFTDSKDYAKIYGGFLWEGEQNDDGTVSTVSGNTVTITDGTFGVTADEYATEVYGGYIDEGIGDVIGNTVTIGSSMDNQITGEDLFDSVVGGMSFARGEVKDNTVTIYGGDIFCTYGGYNYKNGIAAGNTVNIYGGTVSGIYGGCSIQGGSVIGNTVNISGGILGDASYSATIYGGFIWNGKQNDDGSVSTVGGNTVTITDGTFGLTDRGFRADVYGGYIDCFGDYDYDSYGCGDVIGNTVTIGSSVNNKITDEDYFDSVYGGKSNYGKSEVKDNTVTIYGGNIKEVCGGETCCGNATGNTVNINGGTFANVESYATIYGGFVWESDRSDDNIVSTANGNTVTITDGMFGKTPDGTGTDIYGGYIREGHCEVNGNTVTIGSRLNNKITDEDIFGDVYGGLSYWGEGIVKDNTVTIYGGTVSSVYGGEIDAGSVEGNTINIYGGTFVDKIVGSRGWSKDLTSKNNTVTIYGGDLTNADVYGGMTRSENYEWIDIYGGKDDPNTLNFGTSDSAYSGAVKSIQGFDVINFNSLDWNESNAPVTTGSLHLNSTDGTQFTVGNIYANGGKIADGSTMTLIASDSDITGDVRDTSVTSTVYDGIAKVYQNAESIVTKGDQTIDLTIGSLGTATRNDQILALGNSRATATAFVNQGEELIELSMDSLRRTQTEGETQIFAAVQGSNTDYDINGSIDVNGWNSIVGIGKKTNNGTSYGIFFETGDGDYNIDNPYCGVRGDGEAEYNGGGIFLRKDNKNGLYTEGAIRIGNLSNKLDHAVRSGSDIVGYDINTLYYGAHIGVGKIIPVGKNDLDLYGKLLYTHHDSERFSIDGTDVRFDSVDSQRLRLGARMNHTQTDKLRLYYGASWEYEFDGDADGRADIFGLGDRSFGGSTLIGELGMNYKASDKWTLDFNFRGYDGQREGISGTLHLNCAF